MSIENIRKDQIDRIIKCTEAGVNLYPARVEFTHEITEFNKKFDTLLEKNHNITLVGRITGLRKHGSIIFFDIDDGTSCTQVIVKKSEIDSTNFNFSNDVITLSDIIRVNGRGFLTKTNNKSLLANEISILAKSIRQFPSLHDGIKDDDERYRKRYIDMHVNNNLIELFKKKATFWNSARDFLRKRNFIEVDTPIINSQKSGATAKQFEAHHNAFDMDIYFRISPELWHKKLIIGGMNKVFEIGRVFRNEGVSPEHAQDYTVLEYYQAYSDDYTGLPMMIELYKTLAFETFNTYKFKINNFQVDLEGEWEVIDFSEVLLRCFDSNLLDMNTEDIKKLLREKRIEVEDDITKERVIEIAWKFAQRNLCGPLIVRRIPSYFAPLGKRIETNPDNVYEFKVILAGGDVGHGFNELNDPLCQISNFCKQEGKPVDYYNIQDMKEYDYIEALEYGMPPTFGVGLSERFFSYLCDLPIRETQLFPLMKPR